MYDLALTVGACLRSETRVDVAWVVDTEGFSARERSDALALTPGGGRVGNLLAGALDDQLADASRQLGDRGRLIDLSVTDLEAMAVDLSCGGRARCLLVPADTLPPELWPLLLDREPLALVTRLDGDRVVGTELFTRHTIAEAGEVVADLFARAASDAATIDDTVVTVLWPVPKAVVVGGGAMAEAVVRAAELLGWQAQTTTDVATATGLVAGLAPLDALVVASHDVEVAGPVLAAALDSEVGYIGALGSRRTQQTRADWLAYRGITDLRRVHGPAGLDIGASTPPEIALSVLAEALAVRSAASGASLSAD